MLRVFPAVRPVSPERSRVAASAWLLARGGPAGTLSGGQLGASQAGLRITYALGEARKVSLAARLAAPLEGRGREAAVGLEWQPTRLPVRFVAEQRFVLDGGRGGPTLGVIAGYGPGEIAPASVSKPMARPERSRAPGSRRMPMRRHASRTRCCSVAASRSTAVWVSGAVRSAMPSDSMSARRWGLQSRSAGDQSAWPSTGVRGSAAVRARARGPPCRSAAISEQNRRSNGWSLRALCV